MLKRGVRVIILCLIIMLFSFSFAASQKNTAQVHSEVEKLFESKEKVPVFIKLREQKTDNDVSSKEELLQKRKETVETAKAVFKEHNKNKRGLSGIKTDYEFETISVIGLNVTREELEQLKQNPAIEAIAPQKERQLFLAQSIPLINADDAQNMVVNGTNLTGAGQVVCVIDTGIQMDHEAFANRIVGGYDFVNNDNNASDDHGHGTHVAGIIAGNKTTSTTVLGVARDTKIMPLKVCSAGGSCDDANILRAVEACNANATQYNITAISGSLGGGGPYTSTDCSTDPLYNFLESLFENSLSLGIMPVFASGNNGFTTGVAYPACSPNAISVGRTNKDDAIASSSNRGGDRLDIYAPGGSITSAYFGSSTATATMSGTSMSTPHVSGAITIIQQQQKLLGRQLLNLSQMRSLLNNTGKDVGSTIYRVDLLNAVLKQGNNLTVNLSTQTIKNETSGTAIQFKDATDFGQALSCIILGNNLAGADSERCPQFNKTAHITLTGITNPSKILKDGSTCPATTCQNVTFANNVLEFDVISFSNYTSIPGCPVLLNSSAVLSENITAEEACMTLNADNLAFDCNNKKIMLTEGSTAIIAENKTNITIRNCVIEGSEGFLNLTNTNTTLTNMTFQTANGSVKFATLTLNGSAQVTGNQISITFNKTFVNSTALPFLNTSAQITLKGLTFISPQVISAKDDSTFQICDECAVQNYSGGTLVFNITSFSTYAAIEGLPTLSLTKTASSNAIKGTTLNYTILINNTGIGTAVNATLTEQYPEGIVFNSAEPLPEDNTTFVLGNITANTSLQVNISVNISSAPEIGNVLNNTVTLNHSSGSLNASALTTVRGNPGFITNITGPNTTSRGLVNYTININNTGEDTAYNVTIIFSNTTITNSLPTASNSTITIGNLTANQSFTVNLTLNVTSPNGTNLNTSYELNYENAIGTELNTTNSTLTTITGYPTITITATDTPDPITAGEVLTYRITLQNTGDETAYNITMVEAYPSSVSFLAASPIPEGNTNFTLDNLTPNASTTVNITVTTATGASGTLTNNFNVTFANGTGDNTTLSSSQTTSVSSSGGGSGGGGGGGSGGGSGGGAGSSGAGSASASASGTSGASTSSSSASSASASTGASSASSSASTSTGRSSAGTASAGGSASSASTGASAAGTGTTGLAVQSPAFTGEMPSLWGKVLPWATGLVVVLALFSGFIFWRTRRKKSCHLPEPEKPKIPAQEPVMSGTPPEIPEKSAVFEEKVKRIEPEFAILKEIRKKESRKKKLKELQKSKSKKAVKTKKKNKK